MDAATTAASTLLLPGPPNRRRGGPERHEWCDWGQRARPDHAGRHSHLLAPRPAAGSTRANGVSWAPGTSRRMPAPKRPASLRRGRLRCSSLKTLFDGRSAAPQYLRLSWACSPTATVDRRRWPARWRRAWCRDPDPTLLPFIGEDHQLPPTSSSSACGERRPPVRRRTGAGRWKTCASQPARKRSPRRRLFLPRSIRRRLKAMREREGVRARAQGDWPPGGAVVRRAVAAYLQLWRPQPAQRLPRPATQPTAERGLSFRH